MAGLNFSFFAAIRGKLESLTPVVKENNLDKASEVLTTCGAVVLSV